ncbi:MAG: adenylate/guanylate cyclase domain-containing protein [Betaproteobacteria bacterium]
MSRFFNLLHRLRFVRDAFPLLILCAVSCALPPAAVASTTSTSPDPVVLNDRVASVELWPAVTLLHDPEATFNIESVLQHAAEFRPPESAYATLGLRKKVVWLRVPLTVSSAGDGEWILDIDYTLLNHIDVYILTGGKVSRHIELGNARLWSQRPLASRSHAVPLSLAPGSQPELLLRIDTLGAMILPITLSKPFAFHARAQNEQMLQGLLTSLGLFLLMYSLLQWISVRENQYLKYALLISGSVLFSVHFFGIGEMYLWTDNEWLERHLAGITALVAACGTGLFIEEVLRADIHPWLRRALKILSALLALAALLHAADVIDIYGVSLVMGSLGLLPALMGLPGAIARIRRGDEVGAYFMLAWLGYFFCSAILVGVVKGSVDVNFWTMHSFQFGATFDMLVFMHIALLGTRRERRRLESERRTFVEEQKTELARQVDERTMELAQERERSEVLLRNMLPDAIADELKHSGKSIPRRHENVSILFTDIVDFTKIVAAIPASKTVDELNEIYTGFDRIVARHGLEKINTVGDAYMAAAGVPEPCADHARRCVLAALEMQQWIAGRNQDSAIEWAVRAGVHSGAVVAGVVGTTKFAYGIWGDTVNVASRMESAGERGRVNISADTYALLAGEFDCEYRGKVAAKGKGDIDMYFVKRVAAEAAHGATEGE